MVLSYQRLHQHQWFDRSSKNFGLKGEIWRCSQGPMPRRIFLWGGVCSKLLFSHHLIRSYQPRVCQSKKVLKHLPESHVYSSAATVLAKPSIAALEVAIEA